MKRIISLIMAVAMVLCLASCGKKTEEAQTTTEATTKNAAFESLSDEEKGHIDTAYETVRSKLQEVYTNQSSSSDEFFNVVNTRLIRIKENTEERYKDMTAIVEFVIYSDYYSEHPYYINSGMYDTVMFFKDGTVKSIGSDPLIYDYNKTKDINLWHNVVGEIVDLGDYCNTNKQGAVEPSAEYDEMMKKSIEEIKKSWALYLSKKGESDRNITIVNSRIIKFKDNDTKEFGNVAYVVEFDMYADFYGSGNYPVNQYAESCNVVFHPDGTYAVNSGYINACRTTGSYGSLGDLIDSVTEFGTYYNMTCEV